MPRIEKTILSLWSYFGAFDEKHFNMNVRVYLWTPFYSTYLYVYPYAGLMPS